MLTGLIGILITLFILSILVLIHEFGHFSVAKLLGIKVEEFGYGFPPRAWGKKIGETIYSINWLPIGGFVKLYGEDEAGGGKVSASNIEQIAESKKDLDRAFFARPVWQRASVVIAGVIMNALLSFILFYIFLFLAEYATILPLYPSEKKITPFFMSVDYVIRPEGVYVEAVADNSPAKNAGIVPPVRLISMNNQPIKTDADPVIAFINKNKGKSISLAWEEVKTGTKKTVNIVPRDSHPKNEGALGISLNELPLSIIVLEYKSTSQKAFSGISHPLNLMSYNFTVLGQLIEGAVQKKSVEELGKAFSGPVGIVKLGGDINRIEDLKQRLMQFLNLAGLLSISLAVFNILPIPALDGGRLFFILVEGVIGKKVSPKTEAAVHTAGMIVLLALILLVTFKDVLQLFR